MATNQLWFEMGTSGTIVDWSWGANPWDTSEVSPSHPLNTNPNLGYIHSLISWSCQLILLGITDASRVKIHDGAGEPMKIGAQVVFPLWTKWLVTNPMPTQYWHEAAGRAQPLRWAANVNLVVWGLGMSFGQPTLSNFIYSHLNVLINFIIQNLTSSFH